jgi:hypothetical protein
MWSCDLYICPNSGRILVVSDHDDKALCHCGKPNPLATAYVREREVIEGNLVAHVVAFLKSATPEQYERQIESDKRHLEDLRRHTEWSQLPLPWKSHSPEMN